MPFYRYGPGLENYSRPVQVSGSLGPAPLRCALGRRERSFLGTQPEKFTVLWVVDDVHLPVTVRTERHSVLNAVITALSQPFDVMRFEVWPTGWVSKWSGRPAKLAGTIGPPLR